jgi:superfamily II DNA/RNA helicase
VHPPTTFASLGVPADLVTILNAQGITTPFPIQTATIPDGLAGRDITGRAPTGSGKTLAFALPIVTRTGRAKPHRPRALVLAPTRELAAQIAAELTPLARARGRQVHVFYGGVGFEPQMKALRRGVDIAVACPGRLADLINQGAVSLGDVELVVVDEADRMADMGFLPEVRRLLDATSATRQTLLFSATLDGDVDVLIRHYQQNPSRHEIAAPDHGPVDHHLWLVNETERTERCAELITSAGSAMVFTRTRHGADRLAKRLEQAGVPATAIHGGRTQAQRDRALDAFRRNRVRALVATDVAARGIHVDGVACVVQYDLPADSKDYVHRSGRTGRAGATGMVVTMVPHNQRSAATKLVAEAGIEATVSSPGGARSDRPTRSERNGAPTRSERNPRADIPPRGRRFPNAGKANTARRTHSRAK